MSDENQLNIHEYQKLSARTATVKINKELFDNDDRKILHQALDIVYAGQSADLQKRSLFYSDPSEKIKKRSEDYGIKLRDMYASLLDATREITIPDDKIALLHAAIGLASEAGEVMEAVINSILNNQPIDKVNLREEVGDVMWYTAWALREIDSNFEEAGYYNISKLSVRYKDQFSDFNALNRDLDAERKALGG